MEWRLLLVLLTIRFDGLLVLSFASGVDMWVEIIGLIRFYKWERREIKKTSTSDESRFPDKMRTTDKKMPGRQ